MGNRLAAMNLPPHERIERPIPEAPEAEGT